MMVVLSRGSRIPPKSHGFLQGVAGAESLFVEAAVVEPGSDSGCGPDSELDSPKI